jgi:hypothetical protein
VDEEVSNVGLKYLILIKGFEYVAWTFTVFCKEWEAYFFYMQ